MLIGPYVNGGAVIVGGLLGALASSAISERVKTSLPLIFGLCSVGLGINLVIKVTFMPAVVLAMIIGTAIGEILYVERGIGKVAGSTRYQRFFTAGEGINPGGVHREVCGDPCTVLRQRYGYFRRYA